jgi:hypothetical protein
MILYECGGIEFFIEIFQLIKQLYLKIKRMLKIN